MNLPLICGILVVLVFVLAWHRAMREIRRTPEGAFAALGTARSTWETMLWFSGPVAVLTYFLRFRRPLRAAAERATERPPGWYPDQQDPSLSRWWNGRAWTDLVR